MVIPGWQWGRLSKHRGQLIIETTYVSMLRRHAMLARMLDVNRPIHDLWDAQLVTFNNTYIIFSGYNRTEGKLGQKIDYAQTWVIRPAEGDVDAAVGGAMWV